ncbi:MAG: hypothetical protein ABGX27_07870 [Desulfurobacteriaceae bacterium]
MKRLLLLLWFLSILDSSWAEIFYPLSGLREGSKNKNHRVIRPLKVRKRISLPQMELQGIAKGEETLALIDGKWHRIGDIIKGCEIVKIDADRNLVKLNCLGIWKELKLKFLKGGGTVKVEKQGGTGE